MRFVLVINKIHIDSLHTKNKSNTFTTVVQYTVLNLFKSGRAITI